MTAGRVRLLCCLALSAMVAAAAVHGAEGLPSSVPQSPLSLSALLQVLFGLALVVAAILATGWVLKRVGPTQSAGGLLRVVGGVMVGPRERLVVVEVGEHWLVLGVAAGSVNLLHTLPRVEAGAGSAQGAQADGAFDAARLRRLLASAGRNRP